MKIVFSDYYYDNLKAEMEELKALGSDVEIVDLTKLVPGGIKDPKELLPYVEDADALIVQFAKVTPELIAAMKKCKVIARYAIGVDTIDLDAAKAKGIHVANVPDYCVHEVADTAMAHILNAARKLSVTRDMLLANSFDMNRVAPSFRLEDATLGLLGFGNIARNLYRKSRAFFKNIVAFDPYFTKQEEYPDVKFLSLDEVLAQSDVISVHVPLNASTKNMLSDKQFSEMKPNAILVNTARGGLIDEEALLRALDSGKLAYVGTDVINGENFAASLLLKHPKVALTPHVAWRSNEAQVELQRKVARNVVSALTTGKPVYCLV